MMDPAKELRAMGFKPDQIATATVNGKPLSADKAKPHMDGYRSKTERQYAMVLGDEVEEGTIERFEFESMKFKLADGAWFCPDFCVWLPAHLVRDGTTSPQQLELREIKGGFVREAARVRFLVAKRLYPEFSWRMIQKQRNGWWIDIF